MAEQQPVTVSNERLLSLIKTFKEDQTDEIWNKVLGEIVMNARFLMPARLNPNAAPPGAGDLAEMQAGARLQFIMITTTDNQRFFLAFTDANELRKWQVVENQQVVLMNFDSYASLILKDENIAGFVINPFGENLALNRKMVQHLKTRKEILLKGHAQHVVQKDTPVKLRKPDPYPTEMAEAMAEHMKKDKVIQSAFLMEMQREGMDSYLCVVDFQGDKDQVFEGIAGAAKPFLKGKYLDLVALDSSFGKKATEKAEPFYEKKKKKFGLF